MHMAATRHTHTLFLVALFMTSSTLACALYVSAGGKCASTYMQSSKQPVVVIHSNDTKSSISNNWQQESGHVHWPWYPQNTHHHRVNFNDRALLTLDPSMPFQWKLLWGILFTSDQLSFWVRKYGMPAPRINCGSWAEYPNVSGSQKMELRAPNSR